MQQSGVSCPGPVTETIINWGQYSHMVPSGQKPTIDKLADLIVSSFAQSLCPPFRKVTVVGHADKDWHGAGKEMRVSFDRAMAVQKELTEAVKKLWSDRNMGPPPVGGVDWEARGEGAKHMIAGPYHAENRRVEVTLIRSGAPIPPRPPADTTKNRIDRSADLLKQKPIPGDSGDIQRTRLRCVFEKMRNNPNVEDMFLDGLKKVILNGDNKRVTGPDGKVHFVWAPGPPKEFPGVSYKGNYGILPEEEFLKFFDTVRRLLNGSNFARTQPDDIVLSALGDLDTRIFWAIRKVDEHLAINGIASDKTRVKMNNLISQQQNNPNSIYACYK
ncbi:MAG: hypothetical protein ABTR07_02965 [Candidatus Competibacter denitrificans]